MQQVEDFALWLRAQPEVKHVTTYTDIMKRLNRNMHGDDPAWYRLPQERDLAAQYLLLYEFSLPFGLDLTNLVNLDKSATRLIAGLRGSSTKEILALQVRASDWQHANAPTEFFHPGASSDAMFAHIGQRNVRSMLLGSLIGLVAISLVIAIALRSFGYGLLSLLLNVLPMLVGFGIWGLTVGRVGMGLSVVSGLTMGIVVDFTVHLLSKYRLAQERDGLNTPDAIRYAFSTVGAALVVTTVVLIANFGLLHFSVFTLNSEMGELTAGIIFVALLVDLFFLPPVLLLLSRGRAAKLVAVPAGSTA
jgi:predicted RND superfamily exporter protein